MKLPKYIFFNGEYVDYQDAKIHVLSTANKFAATVYEGIRGYCSQNAEELFIFRYKEHIKRLFASMKIMRMENAYSEEEFKKILIDLIKKCDLKEDIHIRHQSLVLAENGAIDSTAPVGTMIAAIPTGRFFGDKQKKGVHACISSWRRISDNDMPPRIKTTGNYQNSRLVSLQAKEDGYDSGILLTNNGYVSEGAFANLFIVKNGQPITPLTTDSILEGVTRSTIIELFANEFNLKVIERHIERTELYTADEAFFCGSGAEVTPIASIDRYALNSAEEGSLASQISRLYIDIARGNLDKYKNWLTPVYKK
jgi:branched-chain amino acid aminotransferase